MVDKNTVAALLKQHFKIKGKVSINDNAQVSVAGEVVLKTQVKQLPVQFHTVTGDFVVGDSMLVNLKGSPISLGGGFYCGGNQLTSLEHAPTHVNGDFQCGYNKLKTLQHAPVHVTGDFTCSENKLTSLQYAPSQVGGRYSCYGNKLVSLEHAPTHVEGDFECQENKLSSLKGAPLTVRGDFVCDVNPLISLEGLPNQVSATIYISYSRKLPLLRLLMHDRVSWTNAGPPRIVVNIMQKYEGQGKPGAIKAAAELVKAGYKDNARW